MGMFDTIHINKKFLPTIREVEKHGYSLNSLQTKDFDSLLEDYYVEEDGKLFLDKVEYMIIENPDPPEKKKWSPPFFQEEKSRERVFVPYTGEITAGAFFMDYTNPKDEIFIDIDFKFIDGIIQSKGIVKILRITPVEEVLENRRQIEERKHKRDNDVIYQISRYLYKAISRLIFKLNKLQNWLSSYEPK
jgi:hypothetical protein